MKTLTKTLLAIAFALPFVNAKAEDYGFGDMGGVFNVSESGAATYTLPFDLPEGINGMVPSLGLVYNSQSGNGVVGMGVSIYGTSVITRTAKDIYHDEKAGGITYTDSDVYSLDGVRLVQIAQNDYRPESSPNDYFMKTTYGFKAELQNGNVAYFEYKATANGVAYAWYLNKVEDRYGNVMYYTYSTFNGCVYLTQVQYGTNLGASTGLSNIVTFGYETRNDVMPYIVNGSKCSMGRRLTSVTVKTNSVERNKYTLTYSNTDAFSRLTKVEGSFGSTKLPPVNLSWKYVFSMEYDNNTHFNLNEIPFTISSKDEAVIAVDLTNDGKDDLVKIKKEGKKQYYFIYKNTSTSPSYINFTYARTVETTNETAQQCVLKMPGSCNSGDFDGDGQREFVSAQYTRDVVPVPITDPNGNISLFGAVVNPKIYFTATDIDEGQKYICTAYINNDWEPEEDGPLPYCINDFFNNGKDKILYIENVKNNNSYTIGLSSVFFFNTQSVTLPNKPEKIYSSDYDRDGLNDIVVLHKNGYTIFWNQGVAEGNIPFSDSKKTSGTNLKNTFMTQTGDFNGDGLADFLTNDTDEDDWYFYLNNGNGTFTQKTACNMDVHDHNFTDKDNGRFSCHVLDLNNDGKDDVVITKAKYKKGKLNFVLNNDEFQKTYTYWMVSDGSALTNVRTSASDYENDALDGCFAVGDFSGNGYAEFINYGYNCYINSNTNAPAKWWHMYRHYYVSPNTNKVSKISVGEIGVTTNITYSTLSDADVYTKESGSSYPVATLCIPLNVVKEVSHKIADNTYTTDYKYKGLRAHLQGRGILGFTTVEANNSTTGEKRTTTVNSLNTTFYEPSKVTTTITKGDKTATTESIFKVITDSKNDKIHFTYPYTIKETGFYGEITTSIDTFDNKFRLLKQQTKYDNNPNMYRQVKYSSFKNAGGVFRPQTVKTIQKHKDDANEFSSVTTYRYDEKTGAVTKMVENASTTMPVTHEYSYNKFGNLETHIVSASDITPVTTTYSYEVTNRFVDTISSSANNLITVYTYNKLGWMTKKQEGIPNSLLTTSYTHDRLGNLLRINYPDGTKTDYTRSWGNSSYKAYSVTTTTTAQAPVTTWYDNAGREVISSTMGEKGISLTSSTSYNPINGKVSTRSRSIGGISLTDYYTYDNMDQLTKSVTGTGQTTTFSYSKRSVAASQGNGKYLTKSYDPWGNLSSVSHNYCSSASYSLFSCGQPKSIYYSDASYQSYTVATMTYDNRGLQTSLTDVDAGKTSYEYDALGRVTKQTDARGNVTTNTYNASGLLTTQVCGGVTTTYTYDSRLRLTKETAGSQSIAYEYDDKNRLTKKTYTIDGASLSYSYVYDKNNGLMTSQTFPDGMTENYTYDANGYLTVIKIGGQRVWERDSYTGTQRRWALGTQPLYVTRKYSDKGLLTEQEIIRQAGSLHKMTYSFDGATGNLTQRTGMNGTETFKYDQFDRLTTGTSYSVNGNIASKTGIGKYTYDTGKKNAVVQVENTDNLIQGAASLTYNAINKVATVVQGTNTLTITYGPDHQRTKTVLVNGSNTTTTLYADNYEQRTANGVTTTYHYVASPDGLAAVYVKSGNTATAYYIETDHLGSIVRAYDYIGNIKFSAAYDAWGNQTVSTNAIGLTRGYTGHEHWPQFGLIDMNGRFYDPQLGRFLSPDPYVQAPENPQNYNRYSYCLNNPLKYSDPDGEWILTWSISGSGFSIGLNFAPYPVGFGINVDWSNGFSLGVYGEFGERAGGNGLGAGIYADQGFSYNFKEHEWSTFASEGAYGSAGPFSVGGSYNQNYNITNNKFDDYLSVNAGLGWGGNNYGYSLGASYTFGDNGGWSLSLGGNYVYERPTHEKEFVQHINDDGTIEFGNVTANDYKHLPDDQKSRYKTKILDNPSVVVDDPYVTFKLHDDCERISGFEKGKNVEIGQSPLNKNTFSFINKSNLNMPKSVTIYGTKKVGTITHQQLMRLQRRHIFNKRIF